MEKQYIAMKKQEEKDARAAEREELVTEVDKEADDAEEAVERLGKADIPEIEASLLEKL